MRAVTLDDFVAQEKYPQRYPKGHIPWNKGKHLPEELRNKLSLSHMGLVSGMKGKHHSMKTRNIISLRNKGNHKHAGKHHTLEGKRKMSLAHRGKTPWINGKKHSAGTKLKMSIAWERRGTGLFSNTKPEVAVKKILDELGINYIQQMWIKNPPLKHKLVDFYLSSEHLVIEVQGDYFHACPICFPESKFRENKQLADIRAREKVVMPQERELLDSLGIRLMEIWEHEVNKDIESVKKRILSECVSNNVPKIALPVPVISN